MINPGLVEVMFLCCCFSKNFCGGRLLGVISDWLCRFYNAHKKVESWKQNDLIGGESNNIDVTVTLFDRVFAGTFTFSL